MKQNDIIFLLVSSAILTIAWIGFSIFHNSQTSTITDTQSIQILPISPHFDTGVLTAIKARKQFPALSLLEASIATATPQLTPSTTPTPTPTPVVLLSTPSGQSKSASKSGGLFP